MKRPSDDDAPPEASHDERLEAFFSGFLRRHPRFFTLAGVALVVLVVLAIIIAKVAARSD